jgi:TPR repeat protein
VQAVHWYRQAAVQGDADAQLNLAVRYAQGEGVEKDAVQAVHWRRQAAMQGHAAAHSRTSA